MEQKPLNPQSKPFSMPVSSATQPPKNAGGLVYNGTDQGAMNKEFFIVEAQAHNFRTVLPHAHITCDFMGQMNLSYTARNSTKTASVQDLSDIQADSASIYNAVTKFLSNPQNYTSKDVPYGHLFL